MSLRGNLFVKIFIGFWLASLAVAASWLIAARYFEDLPTAGTGGPDVPGPPPRFLLRLHYELENTPADELPAFVDSMESNHGVQLFLVDRANQDLLGRELEEGVLEVAEKLRGRPRRANLQTPRARLFGHDVYRGELGHIRAVVRIPVGGSPVLRMLGDNPALRVGLAVLISGLICYLLSRLMTGRLKDLQLASRQLANGDLDARIQVRETGGDETDELARDFNSMAAQLQDRIQAQKRLLSDVSHELRSPLARLRIALALAQENRQDNEPYLLRIEQETMRLEELIGQLLSAQAGDLEFDSHIDLVSLLQQLCADAGFEGSASGATVEFGTELDQALVTSAGDLLRKSFENLLRNALAHTNPGSAVKVWLSEAGDNYLVRVEDQGPGVPEAELERIFDSFYRVDTARVRNTGGYGLGLSIVRRAIDQHRGEVRAENLARGLAVTVTLPAYRS